MGQIKMRLAVEIDQNPLASSNFVSLEDFSSFFLLCHTVAQRIPSQKTIGTHNSSTVYSLKKCVINEVAYDQNK